MAAEPGVLAAPPPEAFVASLERRRAARDLRFWAAHDRVGSIQRIVLDAARRALEAAGMLPTQLVRTVPTETDPSRLM